MQQSERIKIFNKFAESVKHMLVRQTMAALNQQYYIREFKIWEIDTPMAANLYFGIVTRHRRPNERPELGWVENELRLFVWSLVLYAASNHLDIQQLAQEGSRYDWALFCTLFPSKPKELFIYQAKNLLKKHNQYKKWVHQEDQLFEELVRRDNYRLRWSDLGKALFIESGRKFFRTPKQCRERWLNHLDPSKLKKYWLQEQDFLLIEHVKLYGKKWASISKKLQNKRNEHSIKNRYKSLLTKQSKLTMRPFNQNALVEVIYQKLLANRGGKEEGREDSIMERKDMKENGGRQQEADLEEQSSLPSQDSVSIFEEKEAQGEVHDILNNISLNVKGSSRSQGQEQDKNKTNWSNIDRQAFEFSRNNSSGSQAKEWKRQQGQSQMQKRIRADLFLQDDPFEMLKTYFYRSSV